MALDKVIALLFLLLSTLYGYAAYTYPLLPFERNMPFLPNTLPLALGVLGALVSLFIIVMPGATEDEAMEDEDRGERENFREFKYAQMFSLVAAMVLYAILLRPIGFLAATTLFITGSAIALGERRYHVLIPSAAVAAGSVWYLVQETLGIFLSPWPAFLG
ncbi:MAG: tripartite tricarboxylate transporter TctB family protein [Gammaproteobacteria bacterium]|nr:tripartite tricarboxylate transporter TctB family protein [Gammaproteobacteria bacterium]